MNTNLPMFSHKLKNFIQIFVLFLGMAAILSVVGFMLAGITGILWAVLLGIIILLISPGLSPAFIFAMYDGIVLPASDAPELYQITQELAARSGLTVAPVLYFLPSQVMNAFSVGKPNNSGIGLSYGLLKNLGTRELVGVLAHEISHIRHNDVQVMSYADVISRITGTLSITGLLLILVNLPFLLMGQVAVSWLAVGLLFMAPTLMSYLQLSLSRMREFEADREAVLLTGDPEGLATALKKLERWQSSMLAMLHRSGHGTSIPSMLRTHPDTEARVQRLFSVMEHPGQLPEKYTYPDYFTVPEHYQNTVKKPCWHVGGFWY